MSKPLKGAASAEMHEPQNGVVATKYWHQLEDDRIQCDLCPRFCKLREGQTGFCFVRERKDDQIVLNSYGRSSGFCIDPIEKKPLNHFLPGTPVFSFGTAGCNLACRFCQNWDISKSRDFDALCDWASPERIADAAEQNGCRSVAYTYNDPVIFHEYAIDVAKACAERDIKSVAVTNGYVCPEPREEFYRHMHAANIDLKGFTEDFYWKICGAHLEQVLETIKYVANETDVWLELTTLLIPGHNDSKAEISEMTEWVVDNIGRDVPMHFTAFYPAWRLQDVPSTPPETAQHARMIAIANGVRYAYTGNVRDPMGSGTYCHVCGNLLIERLGYAIGDWHLDENGACATCKEPCAGVFEPEPGKWGRHLQPVQLGRAADVSKTGPADQ